MLPRVAELEERFGESLVGVGVHAGKYPRERRTDAIRAACDRLGVTHPVVNDRHFRMWRAFAVQAWPTVVLVSPDGRVLGSQAGEFDVETMADAIARIEEAYRAEGLLRPEPLDLGEVRSPEPSRTLRFPGRVLARDGVLYVSDTGHARVLEVTLGDDGRSGRVSRVFGSGEAGFDDGSAQTARFAEPQGLALAAGTLFVADRSNHAVRAVDLTSGTVTTAAGTGRLASRGPRPGPGAESELRSPWGLEALGDRVVVTMAGSHQLWRMGVTPPYVLEPLAGTGAEEILDGPRERAALAQPTGAASGPDGRVWFADSESSAVRWVDPAPGGEVGSAVGTGLFDHGDRDGEGDAVRLQHPQDVAWSRGGVLVADTYNSKLKWVEPSARRSFALPGDAGSGEGLEEPSGVWADDALAFAADTGNHRVVRVDLDTGELVEVVLG